MNTIARSRNGATRAAHKPATKASRKATGKPRGKWLSVGFPASKAKRIHALASASGRTVSELMNKLIADGLQIVEPGAVGMAKALVEQMDASGSIPVTVTISLGPSELVALARKAKHVGSTVGELIEQFVLDGPLSWGDGIMDTLRDYENAIPAPVKN